MAVSIQNGIASNLFRGVERVYLAGQMIPLLNAEGGTLIEGAGPDIAPTITRAPSILPLGAVIGDSISLDLGAATGAPQPEASWDITLNGDSIRSQLDAGALTVELSQYHWCWMLTRSRRCPARSFTVPGCALPLMWMSTCSTVR